MWRRSLQTVSLEGGLERPASPDQRHGQPSGLIAHLESDWNDAVSMRLACLALDEGRLTDDLVTALAVRGAVLVDLALRGGLTETADAVEVDPEPSGFAPPTSWWPAGRRR